MPPRSKSNKVEWISCELCSCKLSVRDSGVHDEICNDSQRFNPNKCTVGTLKHGFVTGKALIATTTLTTARPEHLPETFENRLIYIHPSTMRLCGLQLGKPVIVDNTHAFLAWPSPGANLTTVALTEAALEKVLGKKLGNGIVVTNLVQTVHIAREINLLSRAPKGFMSSPEFISYLSIKLGDQLYTEGNTVSLVYYGQPFELTVTAITSSRVDPPSCNRLSKMPSAMDSDQGPSRPSESQCIDEKLESEFGNLNLRSDLSQILQPGDPRLPQFYKVDSRCKIDLNHEEKIKSKDKGDEKRINLEDIGGLDKQIQMVKEMMELHLQKPHVMETHGLSTPRGVLVHGPPGTGKTLLAKALGSHAGVPFIEIQGAEIWSKFYGESEAKIVNVFKEARERAPSVVFMDEVDALCPKRGTSHSDVEKRVVSALLTLLDNVLSRGPPVFVLAATNKRDTVDPALRRPGRLDREVELGVPSAHERAQILSKLLGKMSHNVSESEVKIIANKAHGFVGADLAAVCKEAGLRALQSTGDHCSPPCLTLDHLAYALQCVQPSAMREVAIEVPKVSWSDIGGQESLKHKLRQAIEWPLKHPQAFARLGIRPPRGLLMYGPPGCSKTMIAKALARESGLNFIAIKGPELFSKWVGESERAVRDVFRKARAAAPAIIFFDEIDALAVERGSSGGGGDVADRVLAQLLTEIDGVEALQDVTIVAATNRPDRIDKALLRPGRLDRIVYVPLPDGPTRTQIFEILLRKTPTMEDVKIVDLVSRTEGYSGAEVAAVCHEAALCALQEDLSLDKVHLRHFEEALQAVKPRITQDLVDFYDKYAKSSGLHSL